MDNNKYGRLEEDIALECSDAASTPAYPAAPPVVTPGVPVIAPAVPVVAPGAPVYPTPASGYIIPGQPADPPPVVVQSQFISLQEPVISENEAPDHLVMAILITACCCFPLGIAAIYKATECRSARMRGDRDNSLLYGRQAKKFSMIGLGCGIVVYILLGVQFVGMIMVATRQN